MRSRGRAGTFFYEPPLMAPTCPCGKTLDAATVIGGERAVKPTEGDITVCLYCARTLRFNADLSLRVATGVDLAEMGAKCRATIMKIQRAVHARRPS